jgi:hypothetical protein
MYVTSVLHVLYDVHCTPSPISQINRVCTLPRTLYNGTYRTVHPICGIVWYCTSFRNANRIHEPFHIYKFKIEPILQCHRN